MIRKTILAVATAAVVGATALAPISAFAKGKHHHHHRHGGWGGIVVVVGDDDDCGWRYFRRYGKLYKVWSCD